MSVISGLDKGVKSLSQLNINLSAVLLALVIILGPTIFILDSFVQNVGGYLDDFFYKAFWMESYKQTTWQNSWTIFYWSWWIAWSPFVGMFIARISKGRTIREFILSVLFIPSLLTFFWISAFGGTALHLELNGAADIITVVKDDVALSIYALFDNLPFSIILSVGAMVLVLSFFVTSADSGSLVIDAFTSGGKLTSPITQRVFWAVMGGAVAAVLLVGGGLNALQTATITTGLPFAIVLFVMSLSLFRGLRQEHDMLVREEKAREEESYKELLTNIIKKQRPGEEE
jgi:choline/glycine/proline betaine transport protein